MKAQRIILTQRARQDIQASIKWYNSKQKGLGKRFHAFLKEAISNIENTPRFQVRYDDVRCLKVKRFPYLIHYIIEDETVYILAIISTHQNPDEHWLG